MKSGEYFVSSGLKQTIANVRGKYSNQFMSGYLGKENTPAKNTHEDGIKMGGYDVNFRKPVLCRNEIKQPSAASSDFWLG